MASLSAGSLFALNKNNDLDDIGGQLLVAGTDGPSFSETTVLAE